jgi:hypothetical protein
MNTTPSHGTGRRPALRNVVVRDDHHSRAGRDAPCHAKRVAAPGWRRLLVPNGQINHPRRGQSLGPVLLEETASGLIGTRTYRVPCRRPTGHPDSVHQAATMHADSASRPQTIDRDDAGLRAAARISCVGLERDVVVGCGCCSPRSAEGGTVMARVRRGDGPVMTAVNLLGIFSPVIFGAVLVGRWLVS